MNLLFLIPLKIAKKNSSIGQSDFMLFEKNEIAKSLNNLGVNTECIFSYYDYKGEMNGFSKAIYFKIGYPEILFSVLYHFYLLLYATIKDVDVIMINYHSGHLIPILWISKFFKKKRLLILDIRSIPVDLKNNSRSKFETIRFNFSLKMAKNFCDGITCITPMLGENISRKIKKLKFPLGYFQTGVNFKIFNPKSAQSLRNKFGLENKFILIYHGVLSPNRGLQNVIRAISLIKKIIPNVLFMIVGTGDGENELKNLTKALNLKDEVKFYGTVPLKEIPNYIKTADIGVIPLPKIDWWNVSSPIKLKEYLAMSLPVIATDIPAHRFVIEKTGGAILIEDNSPENICESILDYNKFKRIEKPLKSRSELHKFISYNSQAHEIKKYINRIEKI